MWRRWGEGEGQNIPSSNRCTCHVECMPKHQDHALQMRWRTIIRCRYDTMHYIYTHENAYCSAAMTTFTDRDEKTMYVYVVHPASTSVAGTLQVEWNDKIVLKFFR